MQIILSSKHVPFTEGMKAFVHTKIERLRLFSPITQLHVILDVDRTKQGNSKDAVIELVATLRGKRIAVRQSARNFNAAFYGAIDKLKTLVVKEKELA